MNKAEYRPSGKIYLYLCAVPCFVFCSLFWLNFSFGFGNNSFLCTPTEKFTLVFLAFFSATFCFAFSFLSIKNKREFEFLFPYITLALSAVMIIAMMLFLPLFHFHY